MIGVSKIKSGTSERLNKMVENVSNSELIWKRFIRKKYLDYQKNRFDTNNSRNSAWKPLNEKYQKRKISLASGGATQQRSVLAKSKGEWVRKNRNLSIVDGGKSINVLTGMFRKSILGDVNSGYRELVEPRKISVSTVVPYSGYVDKMRSVSTYDGEFREFLRQAIRKAVKS